MGIYPHHHIVKHQGALGEHLQAHHLPVRQTPGGGLVRRHVDVTPGYNDALSEMHLSFGPRRVRPGES